MFFFCCLGGGPGPAQTAKKNTPRPNSKKNNTPPPLSSVFFFAVWAGGYVYFFSVWAGGMFFFCCLGVFLFLLFGRGRFFLLFGRGACFFAVWAGACFFFGCLGGGVFFFLLFGPGACFFFAVWAGDGSSLTYPSAWLVFKRPNNKRDRTAKKKNTGSRSMGGTGNGRKKDSFCISVRNPIPQKVEDVPSLVGWGGSCQTEERIGRAARDTVGQCIVGSYLIP